MCLCAKACVTELPLTGPNHIRKTAAVELEALCVASDLGLIPVFVGGIGKAAIAVQKVDDSLDAGTEFWFELEAGLKRDYRILLFLYIISKRKLGFSD